jgi:predicted permease
MMLTESFLILLPLILRVAGGYFFSRIFSISEDTLVRCVTDFFMPLLVFHALVTSDINLVETLKLGAAASFVVFSLLALSAIYCRWFQLDFKAFAPPIIFMNSGFLGIPLMELWGGFAAMNLIVIYDQVQTFYIFTIGIIVVSAGFSLKGLVEMAKSPLLWAIVLGFGGKYLNVPIPSSLLKAIHYCGAGAPALATFALGCSLTRHGLEPDRHLAAGLLLRFGFGFAAGLMAVSFLGITGTARTVVLVASSLPSAVFSVVLPLRYGVNSTFAAGMVLLSTTLGILTIPLAIFFSGIF